MRGHQIVLQSGVLLCFSLPPVHSDFQIICDFVFDQIPFQCVPVVGEFFLQNFVRDFAIAGAFSHDFRNASGMLILVVINKEMLYFVVKQVLRFTLVVFVIVSLILSKVLLQS